jgi:hypothetical protein
MDDLTITAVAGVALFAAGTLLYLLLRASKDSMRRVDRHLGHVFDFFSGIAATAGLVCLVFAKGWQGVLYAVATGIVVSIYASRSRFKITRTDQIIGILLSIGVAIGVFSLLIVWR